jgi:hypothetical protein
MSAFRQPWELSPVHAVVSHVTAATPVTAMVFVMVDIPDSPCVPIQEARREFGSIDSRLEAILAGVR